MEILKTIVITLVAALGVKMLEQYIPNKKIINSFTKKLFAISIKYFLPAFALIFLYISTDVVDKSFVLSSILLSAVIVLNLSQE